MLPGRSSRFRHRDFPYVHFLSCFLSMFSPTPTTYVEGAVDPPMKIPREEKKKEERSGEKETRYADQIDI